MTHLEVTKYKAADMASLPLRGLVDRLIEGQPLEALAAAHEAAGPALTVHAPDGSVLACMGVKNLWPGVGEAWAVFSREVRAYPSIWRKTQQILDLCFTKFGYRRIQALISTKDGTAVRMDERMGFVREATLKCFGPDGGDYYLYAIVREAHGS